ncbi:hypothetical protein BTW10_07910 [Chromohalobacter japonicus]|uniref:Uncharacterized protein n=2 Tax=Chromohalobacter TaxID=42054 RepID=A0A1Q8TDL9_9GAMM|nr:MULTISPECIES: hypothetical protein [Chromohalobacter]MCK2044847.1 hypothetical protein [Chromohalobacter moromii]MCT8467835.1 hypothetical protein [Chromohalobacter canadensis]MCT8470416.1 hypothetical protein [Chromohalobacter canadensis]MCT8498332.1 hypothetical protein [Chromohalobacter canadensis]OLO11762.1 hypothetical protein BTW10_07910 [Chromohalobacter japonicus]
MHNLWIPVVAILAVAGLIFGGQAYSDAQRDAHIAAAIAEGRQSQTPAEISHLVRVNKGYGVCGDYTLANGGSGPFYYNSATKRLALSANADLYRDNCVGVSDS